MVISETTKLIPGSPAAKQLGCTCVLLESKDDEQSYSIAADCPLHWHINLMSKTTDIHQFVVKSGKENTLLYAALIAIAIFLVLCFTFGGI